MTDVFPSYYNNFKCIANLCPDSCCKDWDVVVDEESEAFYSKVEGELGDKIRSVTVTDGDGDRIFVSEKGRCPFWNSDMLCDIYIGLGEEHLCRTCKSFPRITLDFTTFREHMLSFACPEAARLMLTAENAYAAFENAEYDLCGADYDADIMGFLLKARRKTAEILSAQDIPFSERLKDCLLLNAQVQTILNGDEPSALEINSETKSCQFIFEIFKKLEIMNDSFQTFLEVGEASCDTLDIKDISDNKFEKLALYYIYRYYLNAIDSYDVLSTIKRIVCAYIVIGKYEVAMDKNNLKVDMVQIMQQYSKEIEHSYENGEELDFEFAANPDFSTENLIRIL